MTSSKVSQSGTTWDPKALWGEAYENLSQQEPDLVASFEDILGASSTSPDQITDVIKNHIDKRDERQWVIKLAGKPVKIREFGEKVIKFAAWSKDLVSLALTSQPHMALAWSGITMIFPVSRHHYP